jgi:hypothetical protein
VLFSVFLIAPPGKNKNSWDFGSCTHGTWMLPAKNLKQIMNLHSLTLSLSFSHNIKILRFFFSQLNKNRRKKNASFHCSLKFFKTVKIFIIFLISKLQNNTKKYFIYKHAFKKKEEVLLKKDAVCIINNCVLVLYNNMLFFFFTKFRLSSHLKIQKHQKQKLNINTEK